MIFSNQSMIRVFRIAFLFAFVAASKAAQQQRFRASLDRETDGNPIEHAV